MDYSENQKRLLNQAIFNGNIDPLNLPDSLYKQTALHLTGALEKGAGINYSEFQFGTIGKDMAYNLRENIYLFSGAKTFQYVLSTKNLVIGEDGQVIPFKEFEKLAGENFDLFHKTWLKTEWATAQISAKNIVDFKEFEANAEFFPFLKYRTLHDSNVSEVCKQFDGVVKRVGSDWFKTNAPQNHFNCRCYLEPLEEGVETNTSRKTLKPQGIFAQNPAETGKIFTKEHPYFDVPPQFEKFAKNNFNLDLPENPKQVQYVNGRNVKEIKQNIFDAFKENTILDVSPKITFDSTLSLDALNARAKAVFDLTSEYNLNPSMVAGKDIKISFKSTKGSYGSVRSFDKKVQLHSINFGSKNASIVERGRLSERQHFKSRADTKNFDIATVVHEFAHVMALTQHVAISSTEIKAFFTELRVLKNAYSNELAELSKNGVIQKEYYNIHLGNYANTNLNEFMAEGFTEYKLSSNPSKYAVKIGNLIDKTFKK
jgi:hypothetical protein